MKTRMLLLLAATFAFFSCEKIQDENLENVDNTTTPTNVEISVSPLTTRATISDSGSGAASFAWETGDEIGVVAGGQLVKFTLSTINGDGSAVFTATLPPSVTVENNADIAYPYVAEDYTGGVFSLSYPTEYTATASNSFRHRWAGKLTQDGVGKFHANLQHQTGILRVTYSNVPASADAVTLTADKNLAGESKTITMNFSWHEDGEMSFYFPVPAASYSSFSVALKDGDMVIAGSEKTMSGATMTVNTGYIYRTPTISFTAPKVLVAIFSFTGNTLAFANKMISMAGANMYAITPTEAYTADNNNYYDSSTRAYQEQYGPASARPSIVTDLAAAGDYDILFLGFPIWYGKVPRVILTFLDTYDFSGKKVIPFATSGSSAITAAETELQSTYPGIVWQTGRRLNGVSDSDLTTWLQTFGLITHATDELLKVTAGHTTFTGTLAGNATSTAFEALLPMNLSMTELNGNEKYHYLGSSLPSAAACPGNIEKGDIWLYGDNCVVLFYDSFPTVYSYTKIGKLINPAGLETVLGAGNIEVGFAK